MYKIAKKLSPRKLITMLKMYFSIGNILKTWLLTGVIQDKPKFQDKNIKATKFGAKLKNLAQNIEIRKGLNESNERERVLISQLMDLYFRNFDGGISRYKREYFADLKETVLKNPNYYFFIDYDSDKKPASLLILTDNMDILQKEIWLDPEFLEGRLPNFKEVRKFWATQVCVDRKERNGIRLPALIAKVLLFCRENQAVVFFDWAAENVPFLPATIKQVGKEIGIPVKSKHISCEVCSVFWPGEYKPQKRGS